jgi:transcriptional regulator with XRE-family HTH domain
MPDDYRECTTLGERLKWARLFREYTNQKTLAKLIGVTRYTIGRYEADDYPPPDDQIELLANHLQMRRAWLRYGDGPPYVLPNVERYLQGPRGQALAPHVQEELRNWSHSFYGTLTPSDEQIEEAILVIEVLLARARKRAHGDKGA